MTYKLSGSVALSREPGATPVTGETCTGEFSSGIRTQWRLSIEGHPDLLLHDTEWRTAERDIVTARPLQVPTMPKPLSALLGRKRSGVRHLTERGRLHLLMAVCLILPDKEGWPRQKWCTSDQLLDVCGAELLDVVHGHGVSRIDTREAILREEGRQRNRLCALVDPANEVAPVALHAITHVVPTLKHVGWL
ncbi:hypothetical protein OG427_07390 [Streptomyces sp. NBC_00133]|uniref:hypothetical protein n=1 Tax=Streptomyces sp. NBC_00133 TaxID=2903624 RepID=UPI0032455D70